MSETIIDGFGAPDKERPAKKSVRRKVVKALRQKWFAVLTYQCHGVFSTLAQAEKVSAQFADRGSSSQVCTVEVQ